MLVLYKITRQKKKCSDYSMTYREIFPLYAEK
jgi:hypothetical protein